jgi:hypothetical protein
MRATVVTHRAARQMSFRAKVQLLVYRRPERTTRYLERNTVSACGCRWPQTA